MEGDRPEDVRVLHVDDDPDFAEVTATFLEREAAELTVQTAHNAFDGLDVLERERIDCVVSDYQMPEMDGVDFLLAVRERYPDLPFVLFTGQGSEEVASEAIAAGVTDYFQKETGMEQYGVLADRIADAVDR